MARAFGSTLVLLAALSGCRERADPRLFVTLPGEVGPPVMGGAATLATTSGRASGDSILVGSAGSYGCVALVSMNTGEVTCLLYPEPGESNFGRLVTTLTSTHPDVPARHVVGAWREDEAGSGAWRLRAYGPECDELFAVTCRVPRHRRSFFAAVGDLDGDRVDDLVVCLEDIDHSAESWGRVLWLSGVDGRVLIEQRGAGAERSFGCPLGPVGDLNGDGRVEALVSSAIPGEGRRRRVTRAHGLDGAEFALEFESWQDTRLVAGADFDLDGIPDLIVAGAGARVRSGVDGRTLLRVQSDGGLTNFGARARALPDLDGDGRPELAVSEPGFDARGAFNVGRVHIYSGASAERLVILEGSRGHGHHGATLGLVDDADGDGVPELLVGGSCPEGGRWRASVYRYPSSELKRRVSSAR